MRRSVKRRVWSRVGVVASVAVAAVGLSLASAGAVTNTTIGQAGSGGTCANGGVSASYLQGGSASPSYAVPAGGGLVTSWTTQAGANGVAFALEVWRPVGGSNYMLVGISSTQTFAANTGLHTAMLSAPIAVAGGDVLGLYAGPNTTTDCIRLGNGSFNSYVHSPPAPPVPGEVLNFSPPIGTIVLNVEATVVQGQCGPGLTAHYSSGALGSGFDSGVWCVNAQGIGTYTQDGRIAPGRIIKVGNIIWFQADGNNLRVSGYVNTANGASSFVQTNPISATGKVITFT